MQIDCMRNFETQKVTDSRFKYKVPNHLPTYIQGVIMQFNLRVKYETI